MSIARFNRMLKNAKENSDILARAKKYTNDGKLPQGILLKTMEDIKSDIEGFIALRQIDADNEKMPIKKVTDVIIRRESLKQL